MKKTANNLLLTLLLLFISCSSERIDEEHSSGGTPDLNPRREVQLTLRNRLSLNVSSPRAIATAAENTLSTLDVYVFGSDTENGTYTFQERFCYRDDNAGPIPADAGELQLSRTGSGNDAETTGLLSLKRGLFVKLYCIANDTLPVNPATGKPLASKDLVPITFNKEKGGSPIAFVGSPSEAEFLAFYTSLLTGKADGKKEVLRTPLAMSGALTTPLDLTGWESASRLQAGFRLARLAARFDIVNKEAESRFSIQSVSLGNGRRGSTFFPIAATGNHPAQDGDLITYAGRDFAGMGFENVNANQGLSTGAFYCYPSLEEDNGYLILKGNYRVNETESKEVSYRIPFRRLNADGTGSLLEINNNHRYTVGITAADEYHLDFTLDVADWNDEGSVDDYEPDNKPGEISIIIPDGFKDDTEDSYDEVRKIHTVSMSLAPGSEFTAKVGATSPLQVTKTYSGGVSGRKYDWLQISAPSISRVGGSEYSYTFSLTKDYTAGFYPRCTVRIFDALSGEESILYVDALSVPQPVAEKQPDKAPNGQSDNPNTYDPVNASASLYRITGSAVRVRLACPDGLEEVTQKPDWLDVKFESQNGPEYTYMLTLNDRDVSEDSGEVIFKNKKRVLSTILTVTLLEAPVKPNFSVVDNANNSYLPPSGTGASATPATVVMSVVEGNSCTIPVTSMDGVAVSTDFDGGPEWLTHDGPVASKAASSAVSKAAASPTASKTVSGKQAAAAKKASLYAARGGDTSSPEPPSKFVKTNNITFTLVNDKLAGAGPVTVTLVNRIQGPDSTFVIKPVLKLGTLEKASSIPVDDVISEENGKKKLTLYKLPKTISYMTVKVTSYGGSTLTSSDDTILKVEKTSGPQKDKARATSSADQTDNVAYYKLTALKAGTATLTHCNHTDNTQFEEYAVEVIASDITTTALNNTVTLTAQDGQSASAVLASPKGFRAEITDYDGSNGGTQWMDLQTDDFEGGSQTLVALANDKTSKVRPVTVTLTNKIENGGDLTLTFTPTAKQPVVAAVANTASPSQNIQVNATTLKLYRVKGSTISFKASAIGGTRIESASGVTVTDPKGSITPTEGTYDTDYTYTVTLNDNATSGSFAVVNRLHPEQSTAITVDAALTVNADPTANNDLTVAPGKSVDNSANFPEGFTTEVDWDGGNQWFTVNNSNNFGSGSQTVRCTMNNTDGMTMKKATVTLKNKIKGGEDRTYTVTPVFPGLTAVASGTPSPTQNKALSAGKVQLYRVSNSQVQVKVSAFGGSCLKTGVTGITVDGSGGSAKTDNVYTIKYVSGNGGNLVFAHKQDATKTLTVNVGILATVTTAPAGSKNLTVSSGQYVDNSANFPEGFTVEVNWNGATANWFTLNSTSFNNGNQTVRCAMKNQSGMTMKAATVTLKNKIAGGENKTYTVNPVFLAPTAANGGSQSPTQNKTLASNAIKLYRVSGSKVLLKVSALGGTYLKSGVSGFNVTGGNNNNTENVYTVTWSSGTTSGNLVFAHKQDANKTLNINVASLDPSITASNRSVTASNGGTTNVTVSSPEGCTASIVNGWNGGGDWVYILSANVAAGANKWFTIAERSDNSNTVMKPITIRLTNAISGGGNKDITLTPINFVAPSLSATSGSDTDYYLNTAQTKTFTATAAGGTGTPVSSNTGVATVSVSGTTVTVTPKGLGSCTITVPNGSDGTKTSTYTFTVSGKTYDGKAVYKDLTTGLYIAPSDAGSGSQSDGKSACAKVKEGYWYLPSREDWESLQGSFSFLTGTAGLSVGQQYWSSTGNGIDYYYYVEFRSSSIVMITTGYGTYGWRWRCVFR